MVEGLELGERDEVTLTRRVVQIANATPGEPGEVWGGGGEKLGLGVGDEACGEG